MIVDAFIAQAYYGQVPGSLDNSGKGTQWTTPCTAILPDLTMNVGGATFLMPGKVFHSQVTVSGTSGKSPAACGRLAMLIVGINRLLGKFAR